MEIREKIGIRAKEAEREIERFLPKEEGYAGTLYRAMNYSVRAGGKRLRPILMASCHRLLGGDGEHLGAAMAAIEMIHTYSLVHDDLPAMDNDLLRRGKPTTHAAYGEAMAILAGDGLLNHAFTILGRELLSCDPSSMKNVARVIAILSEKAGIDGMIGGQTVDVESEKTGSTITKEKLDYIYEKKTGCLLAAAMMCGGALAGAGEEKIQLLGRIGEKIGLAFQIQDDILDVVGNQEILGKPIGSDEKNQKATYVTYEGLEKAASDVLCLTQEAGELLQQLDSEDPKSREEAVFLQELFSYLTRRDH